MDEQVYQISPKPARNLLKRRQLLSTTSSRKKTKVISSNCSQSPGSSDTNSSSDGRDKHEDASRDNAVQHIEDNFQKCERRRNLIYGNQPRKPLQEQNPETRTHDVFASARLLETAHSSQKIVARPAKPDNRSAKGFVALSDHFPSPSLHLGSQLPVTNTQLFQICSEADSAQTKTDGKVNIPPWDVSPIPKSPNVRSVRESILEDFGVNSCDGPSQTLDVHSPVPDVSPFPKSPQVRSVRESILEDFGVNSRDEPSQTLEPHSPSPVLRRNIVQTYTRTVKSTRRLFESNDGTVGIDVPETDSSVSGLSEVESDNEPFQSCIDSRISFVTSPPPDPNLSGGVLGNLMNLSFYYSQNQDEPAADDTSTDATAANQEVLRSIMLHKPDDSDRLGSVSGDSSSFYGFGESITLEQNFELGFDDIEVEQPLNESVRDVAGDLNSFLEDDNDIFADMESPEKADDKCWPGISQNTHKAFKQPPEPIDTGTDQITNPTHHKETVKVPTLHQNIFDDELLDDINSSKSTNQYPTFAGFSTGRGARIVPREESFIRSRKIFEKIDESDVEPLANISIDHISTSNEDFNMSLHPVGPIVHEAAKVSTHSGLSTGRGSTVDSFGKPNPSNIVSGFSTARGVQIKVSDGVNNRRKNIFEDFDMKLHPVEPDAREECNEIFGFSTKRRESIETSRPNPDLHSHSLLPNVPGGFSTGRGVQIHVSDVVNSKRKNIFEDFDMKLHPVEPVAREECNETTGFSTGRRKSIEKSSKNLESRSLQTNYMSTFNQPNVVGGFSTGRGVQIQVPDAVCMKRKNIFEGFDMRLHPVQSDAIEESNENTLNESHTLQPPENHLSNVSVGFSTGRGVQIKVPDGIHKKRTNIFDDFDMSLVPDECNEHNMNESHTLQPTVIDPVGFSTGRGAQIKIPDDANTKRRNIFADFDMALHPVPSSIDETPHKPECDKDYTPRKHYYSCGNQSTKKDVAFGSLKPFPNSILNTSTPKFSTSTNQPNNTASDTTSKRSRKLFEEIDHITKTPSNATAVTWKTPKPLHTPVNKSLPKSFTQEITASTKALLEDEMFSFDDFTVKSRLSNARPTRLFSQNDDVENVGLVSMDVQKGRVEALAAQQHAISTKNDVKVLPGTLYLKKIVTQKTKWKDFVRNQKPHTKPTEIDAQIKYLNASNVQEFQFNCSEADSDIGIGLSDGITVILNEQNQVGFTELTSAFLSCDSIDPKLLHPEWVSHHLSMIILKLAAMERAFPVKCAGRTLNVENVMLQLKFRYDKEIDRAERSILRKVLEKDAVASRRMVLFVSRIWTQRECELSDGHYCVRTSVDEEMGRFIESGKVRVGTKLMVQGAELVGLEEGCDALEVPPTVRLQVTANSTRRVRWFTKLGLCRAVEPFSISLSSVLPNGGRIGRLNLCILRVYTMLYVDKSQQQSGTVLRSERVQKRYESNSVQELETIERVYSQVSREFDAEEQKRRTRVTAKNQRITDVTDASQLFDILQHSNDPETIEDQLSKTQKKELRDYQAKQMDLRADAINQRVREKLSSDNRAKRKVTPLMKLKVIDSNCPASTTALLSIWSPHESLVETLRENRFVNLCNASASGIRYNELQLSAGRSSSFKLITGGTLRTEFTRKCTQISSISQPNFVPPFNELDTVGLVVKVGESVTRKFQPVYLVDESMHLLCVNFWAGLNAFAYDDLVHVGRFIAIRDVQWRTINSKQSIPCCFATEFTTFTEHPKSPELATELDTLRVEISKSNIESFIRQAQMKIDAVSLAQKSNTKAACPMQSPKTPLNRNQARALDISFKALKTPVEFSPGAGQPTSLVQHRLDKLSACGEPPPLSPLVLSGSKPLNRRLKRPRNLYASAEDLLNTSTSSVNH